MHYNEHQLFLFFVEEPKVCINIPISQRNRCYSPCITFESNLPQSGPLLCNFSSLFIIRRMWLYVHVCSHKFLHIHIVLIAEWLAQRKLHEQLVVIAAENFSRVFVQLGFSVGVGFDLTTTEVALTCEHALVHFSIRQWRESDRLLTRLSLSLKCK